MLDQPKKSGRRAPDEHEKNISVIVGQNIRLLRAAAGLSQQALADRLGVTFQQLQKYESGANRVSAPKLVLMTDVLNTSIDTLFSDTGAVVLQAAKLPRVYSKQVLRAAQIIDTLPSKVQGAAIKFLQSLSEEISE